MDRTGPDFQESTRRLESALRARRSRTLDVPGFRRAAVLVPFLDRPGGPTVLFTRRTDTVSSHKGQVSFPGGAIEPGEHPESAALREAFEEVSLASDRVAVAGVMDEVPSISSFLVTPVVGLVREPPDAFVHQETEVHEPFEVPLAHLLDPANLRVEHWTMDRLPPGAPIELLKRHRLEFEEMNPATGEYAVYFFDGGNGRVIWGLTGRVLVDLFRMAFGYRTPDDSVPAER